MAKSLNFNNIKKQYLNVTLNDEKQTVLLISTPTKAIFDELTSLQDILKNDELQSDALNDLYEICAKIMSCNKTGKKITSDYISDLFDFEDLLIFINTYTDFIGEITNRKNF